MGGGEELEFRDWNSALGRRGYEVSFPRREGGNLISKLNPK